jgi:uncharacterized protein YdaU (DUF1376 family)
MSDSIWWPRYVGDYQRKTAHLSLIEHGAYTLLLDHYYSTAKPLPANASVLHRVCRAFAPDEQGAVQSVLDQFFTLEPDGYHNKKADKELLKRGEISKKRQNAALIRHSKDDASAPANAPASAHTTTTTTTSTTKDNINNTYSAEFEQLWLAYVPYEMVKGPKQSAFKSYLKARKETDHETIIRGVEGYVKQCLQLRCKTKHVATWLNQRGWADDYSVSQPSEHRQSSQSGGTSYERGIMASVARATSRKDNF